VRYRIVRPRVGGSQHKPVAIQSKAGLNKATVQNRKQRIELQVWWTWFANGTANHVIVRNRSDCQQPSITVLIKQSDVNCAKNTELDLIDSLSIGSPIPQKTTLPRAIAPQIFQCMGGGTVTILPRLRL
jgi:hypothetical protein